jgi:surface glycoprotein (TIGR04207 family)
MNDTGAKLRALFLSMLMVLSVFGGTVAFTGAAAANAPDQGEYAANSAPADNTVDATTTTNSRVVVTDLQFGTNGNVSNITVNPGGGASAAGISASDIAEIEIIVGLDNGEVLSNTTTSVNSLPVELDFSGSAAASDDSVRNVTVVVEASGSAAPGDVFDNTINITAPDGTTFEGSSPYDTAGQQDVTGNNGFIAGDVTDSSTSESLSGVEIQIFRDTNGNDVVDSSDFLVTTVETNNQGRYTATLAPNGTSNGYVVEADRAGFETAASPNAVGVTSGDTTTVDLVLTPESVVNNVDVTAEPTNAAAPADGETEITYTVNVSGQTGTQTDVGIPGRTVELTLENGAGPVTVTDSDGDTTTSVSTTGGVVSATTNNTGIAVFNISSGTVQTVDLTFEETISGENATASARFEEIINDGTGSVRGDVSNEETGESIEGASVYAIQATRFDTNTQPIGPITLGTASQSTVELSVTANNNIGGSSLNSVVVDTSGVSGDVSNVGENDITTLSVGGTDATGDIGGVSATNGDATLEITLGGNVDITQGDTIELAFADSQNLASGDTVDVTINNNQNESPTLSTGSGNVGVGSTDDAASFRLINDDTGEVVDADQYRVVKTDSDDRLEKAFPLNESDSAAGNGFVYTDLDGDDEASFEITPLRSANYTLDVAPGSSPSNAEFENTPNETSFSSSDAPLDLTQSTIESRYSNTSAVVSDETDARGEYTLTQLFIGQDQNGLDYVITATASDFTRDFVNKSVTDNDPSQALIDLEPREEPPANQVNITNLATIPSGEIDGERVSFNDTADATAQQVPRDGRTLDVILVETANVDGAANGTVTLTVENEGFDVSEGGFNATLVEGAETASTSSNGRTITVTTGADGTATVFLQSDQDSGDLDSTAAEEFVGITASLAGASGSSAADQTDKVFTGVTRFEVGQMRGDVTNGADEPLLNTLVFTDRFDFGTVVANNQEQFRFDLEPEQTEQASSSEIAVTSFDVSLFEYNATSSQYELVENETVATSRLEDGGGYVFNEFDNVSVGSDVAAGVTLVTGTGDDNSYSLPRVPALAGEDVTYQMGAVKTAAPQLGQTGTSNEESIQVATTGTADILIRGAQPTQPANFEVSNLDPQNVTVTQGDNITVTATIENTGDLSDTQTVEFRVGGAAVASETVELSGGANTTVEFENVSTAGLAPDTYTHGVFTQDDSQTATLTVEENSNSTDPVDEFDTNNDGDISPGEAQEAIVALNNGDISPSEAQEIIVALNS